MPGVNRVNTYLDDRFSKKVLNQHGAFLVGDDPYEVEIVSKTDAIIRGRNSNFYEAVIDEFRFYAEHITNFWDETNNLVKTYPAVELVKIPMAEIQPSQFYVDEIKKRAVSDFVHTEEDLIIPLVNWEGHNVSVDVIHDCLWQLKKESKMCMGFIQRLAIMSEILQQKLSNGILYLRIN